MKQDQINMLRDIAHKRPLTRNLINLADSPASIQLYRLQALESAGLVERDGHHLQITDAGRAELSRLDAITPPRTVVNASSKDTYRPSWAPIRPGADDHKRFASLTSFKG